MKKSAIAVSLVMAMGSTAIFAVGEPMTSATFNMYTPSGAAMPVDSTVTGSIGGGSWSVASTTPFFGVNWSANSGTTFGPGTYTIDTIEGGIYQGIVVGAGQVGGHILFNWGSSTDIDVVNVWNVVTTATTVTYTSTDVKVTDPVADSLDGILGLSMIDGPFGDATGGGAGYNANFNFSTGIPPEPPLTCDDLFVLTNTDSPYEIDIATELLGTCVDDQGALTLTYTQPSNGVVTDDGTTLTYTPNAGFFGLDSFTYTVDDDVDNKAGTLDTSTIEVQVGGELQGNFSMLDVNGDVFGGTNDIVFTWDGVSLNTNESDNTFKIMTIKSDLPFAFFGFFWDAHHTRVFGPGTYSFDTGCTVAEIEAHGCPAGSAAASGPAITMTVAAGQVGAHILFDWNITKNIDVVNVWNANVPWDRLGHTGARNKLYLGAAGLPPAEDANWELVSTDVNGDGINGSPMLDGPFQDYYANFNNKPDKAGIPPKPYVATQEDTKLGGSVLASMNVIALFAFFMMLLRMRQLGRRK